ncbi:MAG: TRAP transporter large permease [Eubacteriales bacterium]|nr:TRAP transporter large permease [Eubacteriales bacterium]
MTYLAILLALLFGFLLTGLPVAIGIELANISFLGITKIQPFLILTQRIFVGANSFTLLAIPMFVLCGYIMEYSGLSKDLVNFVSSIFGNIRGSMGIITVIACAIFAALTGSGPATVVAIGAIMYPALIESGYTKGQSAGIIACGGALGPTIPPSTSLVLYGSIIGTSISKMFAAILLPGILVAVTFCVVNIFVVRKTPSIRKTGHKFVFKEFIRNTVRAIPVLLLPIIILGGIYSGIFTPTEAGTVGCVYAFLFGLIRRSLPLQTIKKMLTRTVEAAGSCVAIVAMSNLFSYILAVTNIPVIVSNAVLGVVDSPNMYLLMLFIIVLICGCLMDGIIIICIMAPILIPIGFQLGIHELQLAMAFNVTLMCGLITPPFGINLFVSSSSNGVNFTDTVKGAAPYIAASILVALAATFIKPLSTWLPSLLYK